MFSLNAFPITALGNAYGHYCNSVVFSQKTKLQESCKINNFKCSKQLAVLVLLQCFAVTVQHKFVLQRLGMLVSPILYRFTLKYCI